jgi:putative addiction module component (TIGR02574 family)
MQDICMSHPPVDISTLTKEERLCLLEELWDSLDSEQDIAITSAQKAELRLRAESLHEGTLKTLPVNDVLKAIRSRNVSG